MFNLGDVLVRLILGDTGQFRSQVQREAEGAGDAAGQTMGQRLSGALKKGIAGAGLGVLFTSAVESAGNFEDKLRTINTVAKLTDSELANVGEGIKQTSRETGKSLDDLAGGFYDLVSAGVPADKAMEVLKNSAVLATGALGTTGEAVDVVTSALNAFQIDAGDSAHVTNVLAQAVADGKTTMSDLAQGFSRVAPIAHAAGISFDEVAASTAIMTLKGASASQAYSQIQAAISALLTPNAQMNELTQRTGINFAKLASEKGLAVALEELRKATKGNNEEFAKALGSSEALTFALSVTGENAGAVSDELNKMSHSSDNGGVAMEQFSEKMKSPVERAKVLVANIQSFLVTVGGPFVNTLGPAIFALNQLGQAFGLNNIAAKAFGGIVGALGSKVIGPFVGAITKAVAAAEIGTRLETLGLRLQTQLIKGLTAKDRVVGAVGDMVEGISSSLSNVFKRVWGRIGGSAPVKAAIAVAGTVAGTVYGLALQAGTWLSTALTNVWSAVTGNAAVNGAIQNAGNLLGGKLGFFLKAGLLLALAAMAPDLARMAEQLGSQLHEAIFQGPLKGPGDFLASVGKSWQEWRKNTPWPLGQKDAPDWASLGNDAKQGAGEVVGAFYDSAITTANRQGQQNAAKTVESYGDEMINRGKKIGDDFASQLVSHFQDVNKAGPAMAAAARRLANLAGLNISQGIRSQRDTVDQAWNDMLDGLKDATSVTGRTAHLLGLLASKELQKGLHSADPAVRAQAKGTKQLILDELAALKPRAGTIGKAGMEKLRAAMKSKDPDIRAAANAIYNTIHTHLPDGADGKRWGNAIGQGIFNGLQAWGYKIGQVAGNIAGTIAAYLQTHSPAKLGPLSEDGGPEGFGRNIGLGLHRGLGSTLPEMGHLISSALRTPSFGLAMAGAGIHESVSNVPSGAITNIYNNTANVEGLVKARNPLEISETMGRFARTGKLTPVRK